MILCDSEIKERAIEERMINPFIPRKVRVDGDKEVISFGLSSVGYDVRLAPTVQLLTANRTHEPIDPKNFNEKLVVELEVIDGYVIMPPNSFALGHTVEYFCMPEDVTATCIGKSTYARCGIVVNVTPIEPGWEGQVVLEFSNTTNSPAKLYVGEGVAQFMFHPHKTPDNAYGDGKYQGQTGITHPKV